MKYTEIEIAEIKTVVQAQAAIINSQEDMASGITEAQILAFILG